MVQPFNGLSYLMVARYAYQAAVVNEFTCAPKDLVGVDIEFRFR